MEERTKLLLGKAIARMVTFTVLVVLLTYIFAWGFNISLYLGFLTGLALYATGSIVNIMTSVNDMLVLLEERG